MADTIHNPKERHNKDWQVDQLGLALTVLSLLVVSGYMPVCCLEQLSCTCLQHSIPALSLRLACVLSQF